MRRVPPTPPLAALPIPQPLLSLGIGWVGLTSVEGWDKEG